nr:DeoR/GlpR transcriptional regulator [Verrucomicrobiota bacterium]
MNTDPLITPLGSEENLSRGIDCAAKSAWRRNRRQPDTPQGVALRIAEDRLCPVLPVKRHLELLGLLCNRGQLTVREVANRFGISVDTARRDLDLLARQGRLARAYGGAVAIESQVPQERKLMPRAPGHRFEPTPLAQSLHQLVKDGETLLLSGGSATWCCAEALGGRSIRMVTNSLDLPFELVTSADVYVLGGKCRPDARLTVGPVMLSGMNINADSAVIGVDGITAKDGLTADRPEDALMASEMIAAAQRTIVMADSSTLGKRSFARIGPIASMQVLITDKAPPADLADALHDARVKVIVVGPEAANPLDGD